MATSTDVLKTVFEVEDRLTSKLDQIEKKFGSMERGAKRLHVSLTSLFSVGAVAAGAGTLAKGILDVTNSFEQYRARLQTILGTQKAVNDALRFLQDFAQDTPYTLDEVTDAFVRMSAYGLQPTAQRFKTIGDFAASMGRTFSDAVEAIADATHGEFERMREFGITKEMVEAQQKNLINSKGQITDYARFQQTLFAMMAARSGGAMERLMNTPAGRFSNLQDAISRAFLRIGDRIKVPLMNAITVVTRVLERFSSGPWLDRIGKFFERAFSVENMKAFTKAVYMAYLVVSDFFTGDLRDWFTLLQVSWRKLYLTIETDLVDLSARLARFAALFGEALRTGSIKGMGEAFKSLGKPGLSLVETLARMGEMGILTGQGEAAEGRIAGRRQARAKAMSTIDQLFEGLGGKGPGDTKAANFGSLFGAGGKTGLDAITELILGGGQLARLGIKPSEVGGFKFLSKDKPIKVDVRAGSTAANAYFKQLFEEFLAEAVRSGRVAVPGGL